jgi:hypothetical protein
LDDFECGLRPYNVNGINGRLGNLLGWLDETAPGIVRLQELKAPDEKFPAAALRAAGYSAARHGQKSWNGVRNASGHPAVEPRGHEDLLSVPPGGAFTGAVLSPYLTGAINVATPEKCG